MGAEWIVASEAAGCRRKTSSSRRDRDQRSILDSIVAELPQEIIVDRISDRAALSKPFFGLRPIVCSHG